ncbi:MAG: hypothetical protein U0229_26225 [Anaeromyxobacter sp.]
MSALPARLAALVLAALASGAPRVAELSAPAPRHVCTCRAHHAGEACECALCARAAAGARAGEGPVERAPASPRRTVPCVEGRCGKTAPHLGAGAAPAPFVLPRTHALPTLPAPGRPEAPEPRCTGAEPAEPETPPPRPHAPEHPSRRSSAAPSTSKSRS